jgi:hypothetical protein
MKWQPMPAMAREPSGTLVLVLCGQPEQNQGCGRALDAAELEHLHRLLLGLQDRQLRVDARLHVGARPIFLTRCAMARAISAGDRSALARSSVLAARVGHRPFAAREVALDLVELAVDVGAHVGAPVVELFLELVFDDLALFLDHQDLLQAGGEVARELRLQRPHHAHLVQPDADLAAGCIVQAQVEQRLAGVVVGLAAGDQAEAVVRAFDDVVVEPVGADVGQRRIPLGVEQPRLLLQRMVGPADVHATGRHLEVGRHHDLHPLRVDRRGGAGLDDLLDRLHAGPDAGEAAHGERMDAQVQDLLHVGREEHRQAAGLEDVVALVRRGGALGDMVVTGHGDDAAPGRGAGHVGMLEHVGAAVHARALAVPDAEHAVERFVPGGAKPSCCVPHRRGGGQLLVDAGLEHDVLRLQVLRAP